MGHRRQERRVGATAERHDHRAEVAQDRLKGRERPRERVIERLIERLIDIGIGVRNDPGHDETLSAAAMADPVG
jgi:hypothetical protein